MRPGDRLVLCAVGLLAFALRVASIDRPLDMDEGLWVQRGAHFTSELLQGRPAATYVRPHPGVTTMWLVGASLAIRCAAWDAPPAGAGSTLQSCLEPAARTLFHPVSRFVAARLVQAVVTSLALAGVYALALRLLGAPVARLAAALLVGEPFFLAYQRFVTTDAMASDFLAIALLLLLLALRGDGGRRVVVASGVAMGLATASRTTTLLVLPVVVAWIAAIESGAWPRFPRRGVGRQAADLVLWSAAAGATVVVLWPALWVAPLETASRLVADLHVEAGVRPQFFLGVVSDDPGPLFYPLALAYRSSPLLQAGALVGLAAIVLPAWRRRLASPDELTALALVPPVFVALLTWAGATKFDRYLLPALPALALVAAGGWSVLLGRWRGARWVAVAPAALAAGQLALLAPHFPACLTYFNPLLGGAPAAERVLAVGQGEGLDAAAEWLNRAPDAETMVVATWDAPAFAPYFRGHTVWMPHDEELQPGRWAGADRILVYVTQRQVDRPHAGILRQLAARQPLHTVALGGVDYVRIYAGLALRPPERDASR